jgi:hypothetical protein
MASGESSGQNGAMGNISASDSGYNSGGWEWLHLIAFTLGGIGETKINHPDNLVAGTVGANRVHKVIEDTIKKLLTNTITYEVHVRAWPISNRQLPLVHQAMNICRRCYLAGRDLGVA